jgi:type II secretory pathway component PulL
MPETNPPLLVAGDLVWVLSIYVQRDMLRALLPLVNLHHFESEKCINDWVYIPEVVAGLAYTNLKYC